MFFKKRDDDIKDIKEAVESMETLPAEHYQEYEEQPSAPRELSAPLFVKVDKYRELLQSVSEMRLYASGTKQLFGILQELEAIRGDTLKIMRATVQRMEKSISEMDSDLLRPRGIKLDVTPSGEITHIESSLSDLQRQLMEMKKELQELK